MRPVLGGEDVAGFGARGLGDFTRNVALFLPLGLFFGLTGRARPTLATLRAGLTGAVLSAAIEGAQVWIGGRDPSIADWIANTLGAACGAAAWRARHARPLQSWKPAMREAVAASLLLGFVLLQLIALSPDSFRGPFFIHVDHVLDYIRPAGDEIVEIRLSNVSRAQGWARDLSPEDLPPFGKVPLLVRLRADVRSVPELRSLMIVTDDDLKQAVFLGRWGDALVIGQGTRGNAYGLGSVRGVWSGAMASSTGEQIIEWSVRGGPSCVHIMSRLDADAAGAHEASHCGLALGLADGWSLGAAGPLLVSQTARTVLGLGWLVLLFGAAGFAFSRSTRSALIGAVAAGGALWLGTWVPVRAPSAVEVATSFAAYGSSLALTRRLRDQRRDASEASKRQR